MTSATLIPVVVAILSSGFLLGLLRIMPERKSILVAASETAVQTVNDALETIRAELVESQRKAKAEELKVARLEGSVLAGLVERDRLLAELAAVREQLANVEHQLTTMTAQLMRPPPDPDGEK